MKKGRASSGGCCVARSRRALSVVVASWAHLSIASWWEDKADWSSLRWRISLRTVSGQGVGGAFGSEGLSAGEHVPDRFGEAAGEVDLRDLGAALLADARFRVCVALAVGRMRAGVGGGLDQRPTEVARSLLGKRAAQVALAGLVD